MPAPINSPDNPFEVTYCPRCRKALPYAEAVCPHCTGQAQAAETVIPESLTPETVRRWHALDIVLFAAMLLYVLMEGAAALNFISLMGLLYFLVTAAAYGLVTADIWLDENSFGAYAYIVTCWHLFWTIISLIMSRNMPLNWTHVESFVMLALSVVILAGLWKHYGPPLAQRLD